MYTVFQVVVLLISVLKIYRISLILTSKFFQLKDLRFLSKREMFYVGSRFSVSII